jgi:hypothetical protein
MSPIFISRDRKQLGEFTEEQVVHGLMNGEFFPSDLAWREGMEDWQPLSELKLVEKAVSQPPPVEAGISEGSLLANPAPAVGGTIPWEQGEGGIFAKWWQTTYGGLFSPTQTFSQMPVSGGFGQPLVYFLSPSIPVALIFTVLTNALSWLVLSIFVIALGGHEPTPNTASIAGIFILHFILLLVQYLILFSALPLISAFVGGGIIHLCLMIFGAAGRGYEATYRATCYSGGAGYALCMVPVLGWIAAIVWYPIIYVIALKEAQQAEYWRVILAVLLPALVCCGGLIALFMAIGGVAAAASGQGF